MPLLHPAISLHTTATCPRECLGTGATQDSHMSLSSFRVPFSMRSLMRPGVPTRTSTPRRSAPSCGPYGLPPYTHSVATENAVPMCSKSACTCRSSDQYSCDARKSLAAAAGNRIEVSTNHTHRCSLPSWCLTKPHLLGQLAGGQQHDDGGRAAVDAAAVGAQRLLELLHDRQHKRQRLAAAGARAAHQVGAADQVLEGLRLQTLSNARSCTFGRTQSQSGSLFCSESSTLRHHVRTCIRKQHWVTAGTWIGNSALIPFLISSCLISGLRLKLSSARGSASLAGSVAAVTGGDTATAALTVDWSLCEDDVDGVASGEASAALAAFFCFLTFFTGCGGNIAR